MHATTVGRFADAQAGRTLNQLTTQSCSELRADWPGPSKGGSLQNRGIPRGKFPTQTRLCKTYIAISSPALRNFASED
ncbi:hypothetical protein NQZ68_004442 [Dissostichus eleginoides]|nr:hypothetical protein NQZ68_004442 [Dissostichus eleginoides]